MSFMSFSVVFIRRLQIRNVQFQLELKDHMKQFTIKKTFSDRVSIHSKLNSVSLGNLPFLYPLLSLTSKVKLGRIGKKSLTHARRSCEVCWQFHLKYQQKALLSAVLFF